ncbi:hypothetical protein [Arthrobacter sp. M4]|uniref:hypothetical protein n=1 Tax=Arthrobacter sp. M4 TaxID=218160 RepID=UPI001CDD46C7|nr:hypothetical protein [Arthrobacter sp. M4]MCA4132304.1 hypothetical protein [Arthrobacter sp. M4]
MEGWAVEGRSAAGLEAHRYPLAFVRVAPDRLPGNVSGRKSSPPSRPARAQAKIVNALGTTSTVANSGPCHCTGATPAVQWQAAGTGVLQLSVMEEGRAGVERGQDSLGAKLDTLLRQAGR